MHVITGDALDYAHLHNSTPGDNIFKRKHVITGVLVLPCYTVHYPVSDTQIRNRAEG